jgi:hypothetical protein
MDIDGAKNRPMYQRMEGSKLTWHLWSEDGKPDKHEVICTIKTVYLNGKETVEVRSVMVCVLPEDSEEAVEGKATVRFTWTEKEHKPEVKKVSRSAVCGLGNKLAASMERKAAFKEAWKLAKAGEVQFPVNGVTFSNRQKALAKLAHYNQKDIHAVLVPEPDNRFDPGAVAVKVLVQGARTTYKLGYIPASQTKVVKALLGRVPQLSILGSDLLGARISIAV